jgi:hypothetical protein
MDSFSNEKRLGALIDTVSYLQARLLDAEKQI